MRQDVVRALRPSVFGRLMLMVGVSGLMMTLLAQRLQGLTAGHVVQAMGEVGVFGWGMAAVATVLSFRAVAGYDVALHRHLGTGIAPGVAAGAGFAAIAIGQTVGLGVVSGALVRWRMLPGLGLVGALRLSLLVAVSFLVAWVAVCATVLTLSPIGLLPWLGPFAVAGVLLLAIGCNLRRPAWMPNLITQGRLLLLAAVDCLAAGFALWMLVPADISFAVFLPVFLLALGAGLVSSAPAGLGAFEIVLLALLQDVAEADLLAGIIAWRVIYHAGPAIVGAVVALLPRTGTAGGDAAVAALPEVAEAGLIAQGAFAAHPAGLIAARTGHALVALSSVTDLAKFRAAAEAEARWPVLYKAGPQMAVLARRAGLVVVPVAREAWLCPQRFRLDIPARAGLRRKLRKAAIAGVMAAQDAQPHWAALAEVNTAWAAARGGEHGFSMGRFDPAYLAHQEVFVARQAGHLVGFVSFHVARIRGAEVWTLDLLRPDPSAPDGTAQALILAALEAARSRGVARLSLAAVPICCNSADGGFAARLGRWLDAGGKSGLGQFKESFAPSWQRLYLAGPSLPALALSGWEIWNRVRHPGPIVPLRPSPPPDAEYEFASDRNPWQREEDGLA